jgi:transcriptional regulator with XRE-family HTH domain
MSDAETAYRDDKIRAVQAAKKLTDQELAEAAGVGRTAVSQITNGQWDGRLSTLRKVGDALGLSLQELFEPREEVA